MPAAVAFPSARNSWDIPALSDEADWGIKLLSGVLLSSQGGRMQQSPQTKTLSEPCECVMEGVVSPVIEVPLWRDALLHAGQILRRSTRRWYAGRFEDGEEHAAEDQQKSSTTKHTKPHSRPPRQSQERSSDSSEAADAQTPSRTRGGRCLPRGTEVVGVWCALCEWGLVLRARGQKSVFRKGVFCFAAV